MRLRCYFAGCRAVGVRDRHSLLSDAALPEPRKKDELSGSYVLPLQAGVSF